MGWFWKKSKAVSDRALAPMCAEEQRLTELAEAELAGNLLPDETVLDDLPAGTGDWALRGPFALEMKQVLNPGNFLGRTSDDYSSQRDANAGK